VQFVIQPSDTPQAGGVLTHPWIWTLQLANPQL
jgi:hypothetical protein